MRARDLADPFPTVPLDADAAEAARLLVTRRLPGLVVTSADNRPYAVLGASQVLRFVLPGFLLDDPSSGRAYGEAAAAEVSARLSTRTVRDVLPADTTEIPAVDPDATPLEVAALMTQRHSPLVAVVDGQRLAGVVTATRVLAALLPRPE